MSGGRCCLWRPPREPPPSTESGLLQGSKPLMVAGRMVGLVRPELLPLVRAAPIFQLVDGAVTLDPALETPETRSQAVAELLHRWRAEEDLPALRGWRDEVQWGSFLS